MRKILIFLKRLVLSAFILYGFNIVASPLNVNVPINIVTMTIITLLGMPGLFGLVFSLVFLF